MYVLLLPPMGIIAEIIATNTRKPLFGYRELVGSMLLIGVLIWPDINYSVESSYGMVGRQLTLNKTIDYPVVEFLRAHAKAGDRLVVYRNVQGMMIHFYLPELDWVGQLDSTNPHALHFRDRLPATAYDDVSGVEWYAVWDNGGKMPKGLDGNYEKVWDYTYRYPLSWWDKRQGRLDQRRWRIFRRKAGAGGTKAVGAAGKPGI